MSGSCASCGCKIPYMNWKCWDCFHSEKSDEDDGATVDVTDDDRLVGSSKSGEE